MFTVNTSTTNKLNNFFTVTMTINGYSVGMQIDTGAAVSIMSMVNYEQLWPQGNGPTLKPTNTKLTTYSGDVLKTVGIILGDVLETVGKITCNVEYQNQSASCHWSLLIHQGLPYKGATGFHTFSLTCQQSVSKYYHYRTKHSALSCISSKKFFVIN